MVAMCSLVGIANAPLNAQAELVSVNISGTGSGNNRSNFPLASADGGLVVFLSQASDLVSNDMNGHRDIFARDMQTGVTSLVTINHTGTNSGNGFSSLFLNSISVDGRFVAFESVASDLVSNDTNNRFDVFIRDLQSGTTTLVSINNTGTGGGNHHSGQPVISADGRFVAFESSANNLVSNDPVFGSQDIFVRDLLNSTTTLVSVDASGTRGGNAVSNITAISADGRFITFYSSASNLVNNDANGQEDAFVRDLQTGTTSLVSVNSNGTNGGNNNSRFPVISANGQVVVFVSNASDLVTNDTNGLLDVFARDLINGTTTLLSVNSDATDSGNDESFTGLVTNARISANGRFVIFDSKATDLVDNDMNNKVDVFVRDLQTATTTMVSVNRNGTNTNTNIGATGFGMSADGRFVVFTSSSDDLVNNDSNGGLDVFVRDLQVATTTMISVNSDGTNGGNDEPNFAVISSDGSGVAFDSRASDLVGNDTNGFEDVFIRPVTQTPLQAVQSLISQVNAFVTDGILDPNDANPLIGKLEGVQTKLEDDKITSAINNLQAFINMVNAAINSAKLTSAEGQLLIDAANAIIAAISPPQAAGLGLTKSAGSGFTSSGDALPTGFQMAQTSPNPFNPSTTIAFALPEDREIVLAIYNLQGQLVKTLVSGAMQAGNHEVVWDGRDSRGINVATGVYLYRIKADDFSATKKLLLTK